MSFTIFDKFVPILDRIPDETARNAVAMAVVRYGILKEEPELEWPYDAIFEGMRDDIDNSRKARNENGGGGARGGARASRRRPPPPPPRLPTLPRTEFSTMG